MMSLSGSVLEVIEKLMPLAERSVFIWVSFWKTTHFFLCYISRALRHFILADQFIKFSYMSFLC